MKKTLLIIMMFAVGVSISTAQSIRVGVAGEKSAAASYQPMNSQSLVIQPMIETKTQIAPDVLPALNQEVICHYPKKIAVNNSGLDNTIIRSSNANPNALYMCPEGFFKVGFTKKWIAYNNSIDFLLGHAYDQTIWRNISTDADTYSWSFENPNGSGSTLKTAEKNPNIPYPFDIYLIPTLTASKGGYSSTYQWGTANQRFLFAGGELSESIFRSGIPGCGNYDLSYDLVPYSDGAGGYLFGTNAKNLIDGVANYFEKPVHKYILDGVWAALTRFSGFPANTEFTMVIHRVVDDYLTDEIATATCKAADVESFSSTAFTMPFNTFTIIDPKTGLKVKKDYLEIEDAIMIEIRGFNNIPGSQICFLSQEFDVVPTNVNYAYLFLKDGGFSYYPGTTSLVFNLEITYSFLLADSYEFNAPASGGEKTFEVISYYSPNAWWFEENLPEWLSEKYTFDSKTWDIRLSLAAKPLPAGMESREATAKIVTYGADMSISVKQSSTTGLSAVTLADTKVINKINYFELKYPSDYTSVSIYNVFGQKIASCQLPATGTFNVPSDNYSKGVYLFNFTGARGTSTVKVRY